VDETHPRVLADPGLLERALANVIVNALDHSPRGEPVRVVAGAAGDAVDVRIVDRGPGVPDEAKDRIFEPFQRYGDAPRGVGVGLGLAVARGFAEAIGGSLDAEDTPGGGLTMVLTVPTAPGRPTPEPAAAGR
jgi:two-component system sensor histidine kinase KdpD